MNRKNRKRCFCWDCAARPVRARAVSFPVKMRSAKELLIWCFFHNKCTFYSVPIIDTPFSKEALGAAMGQTARSCVAVCEPGLAKGIMEVLQTGSEAKGPICEGIDEVD